jgi:hypothetical protein
LAETGLADLYANAGPDSWHAAAPQRRDLDAIVAWLAEFWGESVPEVLDRLLAPGGEAFTPEASNLVATIRPIIRNYDPVTARGLADVVGRLRP